MVITDALHPYPLLVIFSLHPPFLLLTFSASSVGYTRQKGKMENLSLCFSLSSNFSLFMIFSWSFRSFLHFFMPKDFKLYYCYCYHCYYYYCYYCYLLSVCLIWDLSWHTCGRQRATFGSWFFPMTMGFKRLKSRHQTGMVSATETSHQAQDFFVVVFMSQSLTM